LRVDVGFPPTKIGIDLPQFGRAIAVGGVQRAAREAEQQGFDDVWVSDHLVIPKEQPYPTPYVLDPLRTLAFARLDEMIRMFRTVWENSTADFDGDYYPSVEQIRVLPPPARRIPIWIGGRSPGAMHRATQNDGFHAMGPSPDELRPIVQRLREQRPDDDFVISMRVSWDVMSMEGQEKVADALLSRAHARCSFRPYKSRRRRGTWKRPTTS
jgi:alkanesulfonate monooxygenase SsuD/methylene tetrahydromethanopterin reductase-like flavin-dependent oxidoreductase (luciferase family)